MQAQDMNPEQIELLASMFQRRYESNFALANAISFIGGMPALRGFWPCSGQRSDAAYNVFILDHSDSDFDMQIVNTPLFGYTGLAPWVAFTSAAGSYATSPLAFHWDFMVQAGNEPMNANILGLTVGAWVYFDNAPGSAETVLTQSGAVGQYKWNLRRLAAGTVRFEISADGTNVNSVTSTVVPATATWTFVAGRFIRASELRVWVNSVSLSAATAYGGLFGAGQPVQMARNPGGAADNLTGRMSMAWIAPVNVSTTFIEQVYWQTKALYGV